MPEPTIDELAARVKALERQVTMLQTKPPRLSSRLTGISESPADLAARVEELELLVAMLQVPRRHPRPFPNKPTSTFEHLVGTGEDLWESDEELDQFLARLREDRQRPGG
ncbi:MAG TPA: hypothetical protein VD866_06620 [Urbifossiella sp.]|nr:hypothetical protein [Urbifossiella sp.]